MTHPYMIYIPHLVIPGSAVHTVDPDLVHAPGYPPRKVPARRQGIDKRAPHQLEFPRSSLSRSFLQFSTNTLPSLPIPLPPLIYASGLAVPIHFPPPLSPSLDPALCGLKIGSHACHFLSCPHTATVSPSLYPALCGLLQQIHLGLEVQRHLLPPQVNSRAATQPVAVQCVPQEFKAVPASRPWPAAVRANSGMQYRLPVVRRQGRARREGRAGTYITQAQPGGRAQPNRPEATTSPHRPLLPPNA